MILFLQLLKRERRDSLCCHLHIRAQTAKDVDMVESLAALGTLLLQYILPFIIFIGVIGNTLNIIILSRPALYRHACSRYFFAVAINNLFYSSASLTNRLVSSGYQLNLSNSSLAACKIITYLSTLNAFLSPYLIVFASIDRYCASSTQARIRKFSSIHVAKWSIVGIVIFYSLFFIHIIVLTDLQNNGKAVCLVQADTTYAQCYILFQVFLFAVVPPAGMILFGLLTIHHTHRTRIMPIAASRFYRTEKQLAQMLFLQVGMHIFLTTPSCVTYLIQALPNSIRTTTIFAFVSVPCQLLFNLSYTTAFFSYVLSGRIYRREMIKLISDRLKIGHPNRIQASLDQNTTAPAS